MKKFYVILAAIAGMTLTSCTSNEYLGDLDPTAKQAVDDGSIKFGTGFKAMTRADIVGADAATKLGGRFIVGGFKTADNGANYSTVFKDYAVEWTANSAGKTESNTSDWEYVGVSPLTVINTTSGFAQYIKYWDYNDDGTASHAWYDFIAYSTGDADEVASYVASKVAVTAIDHANLETQAYTLEADLADLSNCYVADMVRVPKSEFGKEVQLKFRSLTSKVRIALYETVPGYSVKNVQFYNAHPVSLGTGSTSTATLIGSSGSFYGKSKYKVYFPSTDSYKAHVAFVAASGTPATSKTFGALDYSTAKENLEYVAGPYLGRSSNAATYAGTSTYYQQVLPLETGSALELAVDYDLVPVDGSDGVIHVYGATAYVPATYTKWLANYAYTYIFKISDNSNGWTSKTSTDPSGLFPITFDAIVLDSEEKEQTTITTVAMPSITTYQKGHDRSKDEYSAATGDIYVQVMKGSPVALATDLDTNGKLYTVTGSTPISEATVMDALHITESAGVGRNGLTLTDATSTASVNATITAIPGEDGNDITVTTKTAAKFTPTANTYAYVYDTGEWEGIAVALTSEPTGWPTGYYENKACTTPATTFSAGTFYKKESYIYTAVVTSGSAPADWTTDGVWYKDPDGVTSMYGQAWSAGTYYKKYAVDAKIYAVKVIKVVA